MPRRALSYTEAAIDRADPLRHDAAGLAALLGGVPGADNAGTPATPGWAGGQVRAVAVGEDGVVVEPDGTRLLRRPWSGDPAQAVLLGLESGRPLVAVDLQAGNAAGWTGTAAGQAVALRDAGLTLAPSEAGLAAYLAALTAWHRRNPHCSVCGTLTDLAEAGASRHCPHCGATHFPRTDPVVIMTVVWNEHLLLGSRSGWPADRYSVLAGFVAPGETAEAAVIREVAEESGIACRGPEYVRSQPWPFPGSLMLGFHAVSDGGEPAPRDGELSDVRWFSREEIGAMQRGEAAAHLPGEVSIARWLIDRWMDAPVS